MIQRKKSAAKHKDKKSFLGENEGRLVNKKPRSKQKLIEEYEEVCPEYYYDEDEELEEDEWDYIDDEEAELQNRLEIQEELKEYLAYRNEFVVIEMKDDYAVVAKFVNLSVIHIHNPDGFQPLEKVTDEKKCVVVIIQYGDEPTKGLAYKLKKGGCKVIQLNIPNDVIKLDNI